MKRMLMKRILPLLTLICLGLTTTGCTRPGEADYYEDAHFYLGAQEYESAAALFEQLGEYRDSADYALYCRALQAIVDEEYDLARATLTVIAPFKSSERRLAWLDALALEEDGRLEEALAAYEALGAFANAHRDAERLRKAIPEAAVRQGRELMAKGEYAAAQELFLYLDGYGQSAVLAKSCQNALDKAAYKAAEELLQAQKDGTLEEVFGTGTAAVISPVGKLRYKDEVMTIGNGETGPLSMKLYETITGIQTGKIEDTRGWRVKVCK
jgi:hypothetical protein